MYLSEHGLFVTKELITITIELILEFCIIDFPDYFSMRIHQHQTLIYQTESCPLCVAQIEWWDNS